MKLSNLYETLSPTTLVELRDTADKTFFRGALECASRWTFDQKVILVRPEVMILNDREIVPIMYINLKEDKNHEIKKSSKRI